MLECRAYKTWLKYAAKHFPGCTILGLIDSRVTLGATAKGRSSSLALSSPSNFVGVRHRRRPFFLVACM